MFNVDMQLPYPGGAFISVSIRNSRLVPTEDIEDVQCWLDEWSKELGITAEQLHKYLVNIFIHTVSAGFWPGDLSDVVMCYHNRGPNPDFRDL